MRFRYASLVAVAVAVCPLFSHPATAAPPEVPNTKLPAKVGKPVVFTVKSDAGKKFGMSLGYDETKCPVLRLYSDNPAEAKFLAFPDVEGEYYISFWTEGETVASRMVIATEKGASPPVTEPPKKPVDPPTPAPSVFYFVPVRPDGPSSPAFTAVMNLPEWGTLVKAGHSVKDKTATDAKALGINTVGVPLPAVAILRIRPDGKSSELVKIVPLPTTGADVLALPTR